MKGITGPYKGAGKVMPGDLVRRTSDPGGTSTAFKLDMLATVIYIEAVVGAGHCDRAMWILHDGKLKHTSTWYWHVL